MSTPIYLNNQSRNPYFLEDAEALPVFGESLASVASVTSVNGRKGDVILKTNDIENNSGYITKEVEDLTNYTRTDELPTKLSDFENDEDFQNGEQVGDAITTAIAEHNSSLDSHEDIRENIEQLDNDLSTAKGNITALENRVTADEGQLSTLEGATEALGSRLTTAESDIDTIESKIPNAATSSNQLADKAFVNSSIATNTANFKGTFQSVEELEQVQDATNNDYAFVEVTDGENSAYDRYKYVADPGEWAFEYELNNSSFTAVQWAAINSGITSGDVTKLQGLANIQTIGTGLALTNGELSATSTGPTVVQTTGTSTTDVMSQNAVTSTVFADPSTKHNVRIGEAANVITGANYSVTIGYDSQTYGERSMAIGAFASITSSYRGSVALGASSGRSITAGGMVDIGSSVTSYGYNNSNYRLLTGLYDPQSAHDAANKEYVDNLAITYAALNGTAAPTTATAGTYVGQLYLDTTNDKMYYLASIDDTADPVEYNWLEIGGGPNVVQTTGTSITDVMSQDAVTKMVYGQDNSSTNVQIRGTYNYQGNFKVAIGTGSVSRGDGSVAIGYESATSQGVKGAVALGAYSRANAQGQVDISATNTSYGYNSSNYRLLTGLYDGQSDHDAVTVGQLNTAIAGAGANEITSEDWNALW